MPRKQMKTLMSPRQMEGDEEFEELQAGNNI